MIAIIGAGPAGLAAAKVASEIGAEVIVLDSAPRPGGQYWRHRDGVQGYKSHRASGYFDAVINSRNVTYIHGAQVWSATRNKSSITLNYLQSGVEKTITVEKLILTTGAYDRSIPFTGWELPGSMTPGAAQALLKGYGVVAGKKILVSGTGPFLLPVAVGLAEAGAEVLGIVEAHSPLRWLRSPLALILNPQKALELLYYLGKIRKYSLKVHFGRAVIGFNGNTATLSKLKSNLEAKGKTSQIECDVVASGWGFNPDVTLGGILGCNQEVDLDGSVIFTVDSEQRSSVENIWIAGEATGIGGADLALAEGEIAALSALNGSIPFSLIFKRFRLQLFATALQRSYPVGNGWQSWIKPETKICRCEEVSHSEICQSVTELSAQDSRTSKLFTRAGMGLCQGRVCSRNVSEIIAEESGCKVLDQERISYSNRPIAAPISLGVLADGIKGQ
jgi:NADPH-dependent 2,4-dienoyl-CoA reductase/sulfur reductase-like enzyme/bacterioferritin-associated ferredoxin